MNRRSLTILRITLWLVRRGILLAVISTASCTLLFEPAPGQDALADSQGPAPDGGAPGIDSSEGSIDASESSPDADWGDSCSVYTQEGCDDGQACYYVGSGEHGECLQETGTKIQDEPCSLQTECAPGFVCRASACRRACGDGDCYGDGDCIQTADIRICFPTY